ncbi:syntaxin-12-like isoform X2 [Brienomyrus brachyistius]|uniref:syntaxin-12-like isoform X2 n=1 Tax=Brienomyrus brachyistius TaxID=42636 RepID=UPI0020B379E3|nr:syntaxin-12-like isoform X2 [Brienomyrus brachyistius]
MSYGRPDSYRGHLKHFSSLIQICSANIQRITHNTAQIKSLVNQIGTRQDTSEMRENLQQLQQNTNQLAKESNRLIKDLGSLPLPTSPSEQRQQKIQKERLMNDFTAALGNLQAEQRRAAQRGKDSVARARAASRLSQSEDGNREDPLISFEYQDAWGQTGAQTQEPSITEEDLELIKERETSLRQLESDIMDVNQIFKDLAVMIHDQGDVVDSIEANVESTQVHVEHAVDQLHQTAHYQDKSRKKMCVLILVLTVVAVVLAIVIWLATS